MIIILVAIYILSRNQKEFVDGSNILIILLIWNKFYILNYKFGRCRQNKHSTTWTIRKTLKIPTPSPFIPSPTSINSTVGSKLIAKNSKFSWIQTLSLKPESKYTSPPLKTKGVPSCFSSINLV